MGKNFEDYIQSFYWYKRWQKKATQAQANLSLMYGMVKDAKIIPRLLIGIKKQRNKEMQAQLNLALMYKYGTGIGRLFTGSILVQKSCRTEY